MQFNYNYSKLRCKKLAWMIEDHIWKWHLVFTDYMNILQPKHDVATGDLPCLPAVNLGIHNVMDRGQAPP